MSNQNRKSKITGSGINIGSLNPKVTVLTSEPTTSAMPSNPRHGDIVIDANTTGSIVMYVFSREDDDWR